jgi:hypothetical protein
MTYLSSETSGRSSGCTPISCACYSVHCPYTHADALRLQGPFDLHNIPMTTNIVSSLRPSCPLRLRMLTRVWIRSLKPLMQRRHVGLETKLVLLHLTSRTYKKQKIRHFAVYIYVCSCFDLDDRYILLYIPRIFQDSLDVYQHIEILVSSLSR